MNTRARGQHEFRERLAGLIGEKYADCITRIKGQSFYTDYTLTLGAKQEYENLYGYDRLKT